jgi:hypothetical protein
MGWWDPFEDWCVLGPRGRFADVFAPPLVGTCTTFQLKPFKDQSYSQVELTGQACERFGNEGVLAILCAIDSLGERWQCSRIDVAWDGVAFGRDELRAAHAAGHVLCGGKVPKAFPEHSDEEGYWTVYTSPPRGTSPVLIRVYNKRGPVRFEAQFSDHYAKDLARKLVGAEAAGVPGLAMSQLRAWIDFGQRSSCQHRERARLLPWWASFVGDAKRCDPRTIPPRDASTLTPFQRYELQRSNASRALAIAARACGIDWVLAETRRLIEACELDTEDVAASAQFATEAIVCRRWRRAPASVPF